MHRVSYVPIHKKCLPDSERHFYFMDVAEEEAGVLLGVEVVSATLYAHFPDGACSNACAGADDVVVLAEVADGAAITQPGQRAFLH